MALITLPAGAEFARNVWRPLRKVQVNKSAYTNARRVMNLGGDSWAVSAAIEPAVTENDVRAWRAFIAQLQNEQNTFRMPAICSQHMGLDPLVTSDGAAGSNVLTLSAAPPLLAGHYITVPFASGRWQLVMLTEDIDGSIVTFDRPLREPAQVGQGVATVDPFAEVALTAPPQPDDQDGIFSWSFEAEEAF